MNKKGAKERFFECFCFLTLDKENMRVYNENILEMLRRRAQGNKFFSEIRRLV